MCVCVCAECAKVWGACQHRRQDDEVIKVVVMRGMRKTIRVVVKVDKMMVVVVMEVADYLTLSRA